MARLLGTLLCALMLVPAAAASANDNRIRVYKVTAEGSGTFSHDLDLRTGEDGLGLTSSSDVSFSWKVQLPMVAFLSNGEGFAVAGGGTAQGAVTGTATAETTIVGNDGNGGKVTTHGFCEAKNATQPITSATIKPDPLGSSSNAGGASITVNPLFEGVGFPANCTAAIYGGKGDIGVDVEESQWEQRFFLPTEATRQGKIIQIVDATPAQRNACASEIGIGDCTFDWHGTLTFEFTGYLGGDGEIGEDDIPDLPPGGGNAPDLEDLFVPLPSGGKLTRRGDRASVNVTCGGDCSGTVSAFAVKRGAAAAASKPLARKRFTSVAGKPTKVTLRFRGAAARKVRKAKAVRLVISTGKHKRTLVVRAR